MTSLDHSAPETSELADGWWTTANVAEVQSAALELAGFDALRTLPMLAAAGLLTAAIRWVGIRPPAAAFLPVAVAGAVTLHAVWKWVRVRGADGAAARERIAQETRQATLKRQIEDRLAAITPVGTYLMTGALVVVALLELMTGGLRHAVVVSGLVKPAARAGQWWRLVSATYLHANITHLGANASALFALGRLVEAYDRPLRLPLVYLVSGLTGGVLSTLLLAKPSVGASGAILGLAGYLLVAGRRAFGGASVLRELMLRTLAGTALLGVAAYFLIDNAAHFGGVLGGVLIGFLTLREERGTVSGHSLDTGVPAGRPTALTAALDALGWVAWSVLLAGALFTMLRLWLL